MDRAIPKVPLRSVSRRHKYRCAGIRICSSGTGPPGIERDELCLYFCTNIQYICQTNLMQLCEKSMRSHRGTTTMTTKTKAALELKRLREHAGYSVRRLAAALCQAGSRYGRSPSSYAYYENSCKKPYLPVDLVEDLVPLLRNCGDPPIAAQDVRALAGGQRGSLWIAPVKFTEEPANNIKPLIDTDLLTDILERLSAAATDTLELDNRQTARLAAEIYDRAAAATPAPDHAFLDREISRVLRLAKSLLHPSD